MKKKYKVLVFARGLIDGNLLSKGLYSTNKPTLYGLEKTIESLEKDAIKVQEFTGYPLNLKDYLGNLKQCKLVEAELSIENVLDNTVGSGT